MSSFTACNIDKPAIEYWGRLNNTITSSTTNKKFLYDILAFLSKESSE